MLLLTGASGYVGRHLLAYLKSGDNSVALPDGDILPVWRSHEVPGGVQLDLCDADAIDGVFTGHRISAIIHLAAEARTGICERDPKLAVAGNVDATRNLLNACEKQGAAGQPLPYFLYTSTDMVFRGDQAPYTAENATDAVSAYGRSKADTEELVRQYNGQWAIVRPALIYGPPYGGRVSVVSSTLEAIRSGHGAFFEDELRTPVFVKDLTRLIGAMVTQRMEGIVNAGGPDRVSRYDFALAVANACGISGEKVNRGLIGDDPAHAWRPRDISMISDQAHGLVEFTRLAEGLHQTARDGEGGVGN